MKTIESTTITVNVKQYIGKEAVLVVDGETGRVAAHHKASDKPVKVSCPAHMTMLVGEDAEIETEKVRADEKYAPIKAAKEAERAAARAAAAKSK